MAPTLPPDRRPLVISGPSGVGKGTLMERLFKSHPDTFALSVSHTTRAPRPGEAHGVNYFYVKMAEFEELIAADGFVEHAQFGSNRYGTSKATILEQTSKGQVVVLDIEMEVGFLFRRLRFILIVIIARSLIVPYSTGVKQIKKSSIDARFVFVKPPSFEALEQRLRGRGTEDESSITKRLDQAKKELEYADTPGVHDIIIVNDNLDAAYKELEDYVYKPVV
ncbi:guanylate kinase [Xylaria grammica]|nr:guanylate kinase [Xylaria grammica]